MVSKKPLHGQTSDSVFAKTRFDFSFLFSKHLWLENSSHFGENCGSKTSLLQFGKTGLLIAKWWSWCRCCTSLSRQELLNNDFAASFIFNNISKCDWNKIQSTINGWWHVFDVNIKGLDAFKMIIHQILTTPKKIFCAL